MTDASTMLRFLPVTATASPGMALIVDLCQMLEIQMSIDLGRRDVRMAQQLLHRSQVTTGLQHMAGEGMPKQVGMQSLVRPFRHSPPAEAGLDTASTEPITSSTHIQGLSLIHI